jgi:hypothetical protein
MRQILREVLGSMRTSPVFTFYVLATLVVAGIIGLITIDVIDLGMSHFGQAAHRTHDVTYGLLFTTLVVGMVTQLRRPTSNPASAVMALVPPGALLLAGVVAGDIDTVVKFNPLRYAAWIALVAVLLHPAGLGFLRSFSVARIDWRMLGIVGLAAVPLLASASTAIRLQETITDEHGFMGHYGFMAAFSYTAIALGVLASLRPTGWRLVAWTTGLLPAALGITSLLYPGAASSMKAWWAVAGIAWGTVFIALAIHTPDPARRRVSDDVPDQPAMAGTPVNP